MWLLRRPPSTSGLQSEKKPQRQRAQLIGSTWLETLSISFSSIKLTFVYYIVNIDIIFSPFVVISYVLNHAIYQDLDKLGKLRHYLPALKEISLQ